MSLIPIDCAVNDDYGGTTNRVQSIHFPGLEMDAIDMAGVHFRDGATWIKFSRREFEARHLRSMVGNIYWERYGMSPDVAAACLHYLRDLNRFSPDSGYEELWRWWDSNVTDHALVARLLTEAANDDRL